MTDRDSKNTEALRRLMEKMLLALDDSPHVNAHNYFNDLTQRCRSEGIHYEGRAALDYWWHLARLGVIAVIGDSTLGSFPIEFRRLALTDRGRALLERGESSPHYPSKYLEAVRKRIPKADDIALTYLNEAVGAWSAGLYRSSAVMLGCACERLVLILAERIEAGNFQPWSGRIKKAMTGSPTGVSQFFDNVRDCLMDLRSKKDLSGKLADALDRKLTPIFDHARGLRNASGHPTGSEVSGEDAEASLLLFPGFYVLVDELCAQLALLP